MSLHEKLRVALFGCLLLAYIGCKHEPDMTGKPIEEACTSIPTFPYFGEYTFVSADTFFYNVPYVNPNNPNELVFLKVANGKTQLVTVNLVTKVTHVLLEGETPYGLPKWSRTNWIAFGRNDKQVWLIRPDGTDLHCISSAVFNTDPEFNYYGDTIAYATRKVTGNLETWFTTLALIDGTIVDTLWHCGVDRGCWQNPNYGIRQINETHILLQTPSLDTQFQVLPLSKYGLGITWVDDHTVIWSEAEGLYKADILTLKIDTLKTFCDGIRYDNPSYNSQINKVYWDKRKYHLIDSITVGVWHRIVRMNPDGTGEEEIDIPK